MRSIFYLIGTLSCLLFHTSIFATLPTGSTAPGFSVTDINGGNHDLYSDYLANGISVAVDMSATWCGPCWNFHNSGTFEDIESDYGASSGNFLVMPIMIEVDGQTNQSCFYGPSGCNGSTWGDWSTGGFTKANPPSSTASGIASDWNVTSLPVIYVIAPSGYVKSFVGAATNYDDIESWGAETFQMENSTWQVNIDPCGPGSIDFQPQGGHGNIYYNWSNGATTEDLSNLTAGDYYVTLTDDNGGGYQVEFGPITVTASTPISLTTVSFEEVDCHGNNSGSIEVSATGGTGSVSYNWDHGATGSLVSGLYADDYSVTVVDNTGCEDSGSFSIGEPDLLEVSYQVMSSGCGGATGTVDFTVFGGTPPFNYIVDGTYYFEPEISLGPGTYDATIQDANLCEEEVIFTIELLPEPTAAGISTGNLDCTSSAVFVEAAGSSTGTNIEYAWYDNSGNYVTNTYSFQVNDPGNYQLYVTDTQSNCTDTATITVAGNTTTPTAMTTFSNNLTCNQPTASLIGTGSSTGSSFSYQWTTTDGSFASGTTGINATASAAGSYTLVVTDNFNSCTSSSTVTISAANIPTIAMSGATTFCQSSSSTLCVTAASTQNVQWLNNNGSVISTDPCFSANTAGTYTAILTDNATGCSATQEFQTTVNAAPTVSLPTTHSFCEGESIVVCHQGEAGINYNWNLNGVSFGSAPCITINQGGMLSISAANNLTGCSANYQSQITVNPAATAELFLPDGSEIDCTVGSVLLDLNTASGNQVTWTDPSGTILSNASDFTANNPGTYNYQVTTAQGCTTSGSTIVTASNMLPDFTVAQPEILTCDLTQVSLDLTTDGGVYTYTWTDASGAVISQSQDVNVTEAGSYTVVVEGQGGCSSSSTVQVNENITLPLFSIDPAAPLNCINNSSQVNLNPNQTDYTYVWTYNGVVISESEDIEIEEAGEYAVVVTNEQGCTSMQSIIISEDLATPSLTTNTPTPLDCVTFSSVLSVETTTTPQEIIWTNANGSIVGTSGSITVTNSGEYTAVVTNPNGCSSTTTVTVDQINNEVIQSEFASIATELEFTFDNISADNSTTTTYYWDFGDGNSSADANPQHTYAQPGTYRVCLTTENECGSTTACEEVTAIVNQLQLASEVDHILCYGGSNGRITVTTAGGFGTYTYEWSDSSLMGHMVNGLSAGTYSVTVVDEDNNVAQASYTLTEPEPIVVDGETTATDVNFETGTIEISITGGVSPYEVTWEDGSTEIERTGLAAGMYMAQITDANGCEVISTWEVESLTGVEEVASLSELSIHPNPADQVINITGQFDTKTDYDIYLVDGIGERIKISSDSNTTISNKYDVSGYAAGLYLIEVRVGKQVSIRKLIIVN